MFARLDDWLIKRFEPVAHWIAHNTGVSNYTVAMALLVVWPATAGADALQHQSALYWTLAAACLVVATLRYGMLLVAERRRARSTPLGFEERFISYPWRCMENFFLVIILVVGLGRALLLGKGPITVADIGIIAVWAHLYFAACSQPPPKEWRQTKLAPQGA